MGLREQIPQDLKDALRSKNSLELSVLRMLESAIKNREIDNQKQALSDEQIIGVVSAEIKKRRDAAAEFEKVSRPDAAEAERKEIEILMKYMPAQMSEEEIRAEVVKAIAQSGASGMKDIGSVMKLVIPAVKGKADGAVVNRLVREELEKTGQG